MEPICEGMSGAAVEDVQDRLVGLGYAIDEAEHTEKRFGASTAAAVAAFRAAQGLPTGSEVDTATWSELVDESYNLGDRTLYLRLPNFHGRDVRELQHSLNILGFSCGNEDGFFDAHTERAVKEFQESVGILADGMAFPETFDAINRLHHVLNGKPAQGPHPTGGIGFARAANVLENVQLSIAAEDPISRNIAARVWNLASATSDGSLLALGESAADKRPDDAALIVLASAKHNLRSTTHNIVLADPDTLPARIRTAWKSSRAKIPVIRVELPETVTYDGSFTTRDAQALAVMLLDALCLAFDE